MQNRLEDIGSLIKFLRVSPFNETAAFRKHFTDPLKLGDKTGLQNLHLFLGSICLRRTKVSLAMPDLTDEDRILDLSRGEWEMYNEIREQSKQEVSDAIFSKGASKAYYTVLRAILRLRLLCNHGTFGRTSTQSAAGDIPSDPNEVLTFLQQAGEATCTYCNCAIDSLDSLESSAIGFLTVCSHLLCLDCLPQYERLLAGVDEHRRRACPICGKHITSSYLAPESKQSSGSRPFPQIILDSPPAEGHSTKISAMLRDMQENDEAAKR